MFKGEASPKVELKDRKLGDEWTDWSGSTDSLESDINENRTVFLTLSAGVIFIIIALFPLGWYLINPRIEQLPPVISELVKWSISGSVIVICILIFLESIFLFKFRKTLFPYKVVEKFFLFLLPKTVWLGAKFGISKDRVSNSFIKVNNLITQVYANRLNIDKLLILLPRCLKKETRIQIMDRINGNSFKTYTAAGGEEARKMIQQHRPSFILAIACERDLVSGIKDVAQKIPVIAVSNKRPEGPCKNTHINMTDLDEAITFIRDRKNISINN